MAFKIQTSEEIFCFVAQSLHFLGFLRISVKIASTTASLKDFKKHKIDFSDLKTEG